MVAQNFQRKDVMFQRKNAKPQRRKENKYQFNLNVRQSPNLFENARSTLRFSFLSFASLFLCVFALSFLSLSCSNAKPSDMRSLVPADSLVYLETNDLAAALQPIIDSKPFNEVAKYKPDFSALKGVQLAVAVTGFETSEEKVNDEQSIGKIQPRFVAIADTHAWNFQAVGFAEQKLGSFVAKIYDSEPTLERSEKNAGKYFTWKAADGRKAFALVIDSLIYFGNDESAIDKCLAVRRGEADNITKTGKLQPADSQTLALGYVSTDGIAQIASVIGVKIASEAVEESDIQSAIAGIVPQLIRNSIIEVSWTANKVEQGIEDKYSILLSPETASTLKETMVSVRDPGPAEAITFIPPDASSVTRYNVQNPQLAWRSLMLVAEKNTNGLGPEILSAVFGSLLQPYGIDDADKFLSAIDSRIWTIDPESEDSQSAMAVSFETSGDAETLKKSVSEINFSLYGGEGCCNGSSWKSEDRQTAFFFSANSRFAILGDAESVEKCREAWRNSPANKSKPQYRDFYNKFAEDNDVVALTQGKDPTEKVVEILGGVKQENTKLLTNFTTETRFTKTGIERKTTSDFGLIGSIIAQLNEN